MCYSLYNINVIMLSNIVSHLALKSSGARRLALDRETIRQAREFAAWSNLPQQFVTAEELAGVLRVPTSWVWAAARESRIPSYRAGHYVRFDVDEVLEFLRREGSKADDS